MLDEQRIKLMTRMASYEDTEGKKMIPITRYFRSDYIGFNIAKSLVGVTIAFIVIVGVFVFCNIETFMAQFYKMDIMELARKLLSAYVVVLIIYALVSFLLYTYRYNKAKKSVRIYQSALRKLLSMYDEKL
ncbi:MAG: hypothetical protein K6F99_09115 [Lachnospiraceae bacterium]|nr:hypothetical protein [Lachnospiraceae bacterium]